jgi:hypothetical protein
MQSKASEHIAQSKDSRDITKSKESKKNLRENLKLQSGC